MEKIIEMTAMIQSVKGKGCELRAEIEKLVKLTRDEPGCIEFKVFQHNDAPDHFVLWEIFENQKALQDHMQKGYTRKYFECNLVEETKVIKHTQV